MQFRFHLVRDSEPRLDVMVRIKSGKQLYNRGMDPWPTTPVNALCLFTKSVKSWIFGSSIFRETTYRRKIALQPIDRKNIIILTAIYTQPELSRAGVSRHKSRKTANRIWGFVMKVPENAQSLVLPFVLILQWKTYDVMGQQIKTRLSTPLDSF